MYIHVRVLLHHRLINSLTLLLLLLLLLVILRLPSSSVRLCNIDVYGLPRMIWNSRRFTAVFREMIDYLPYNMATIYTVYIYI